MMCYATAKREEKNGKKKRNIFSHVSDATDLFRVNQLSISKVSEKNIFYIQPACIRS
jgi:hypothetical protein